MALRLWEFRKNTDFSGNRLVYSLFEGVLQVMCADEEGQILLHVIEENSSFSGAETYTGAKHSGEVLQMQIAAPFALLPKVFSHSGLAAPASETTVCKLSDSLYLAYPQTVTPGFHVAVPLFMISSERAQRQDHFLFCWVQFPLCFVFYFRNGQCELANSYPVANDSEVLYFCMAAVKKSGTDIRNVKYEILGEDTKSLIQAFGRFVNSAQNAQMELPYPAGEYPPHAPVSYLLHQYLTCELPEGI